MKCSLIITTYNWKNALKLVLDSALNQNELADEIIIADDGSREDTKVLIDTYIKDYSIPIIHSWQEDDGFRASKSRNMAIAKASFEYIILIDGDMILHKNFVKNHKQHAKKEYFLQGGRVLLGNSFTKQLFKTKNIEIPFLAKDIRNRKNTIYSNLLAYLFSYKSRKLSGVKTCNMSFYKTDCLDINGFNEDFIGWGREDSEFVVRLFNNNIKRKNIKFNAIAYHIFHNENTRDFLQKNQDILESSIRNKINYCENGISKYL